MKTEKLILSPQNYILFGISTYETDYRLCWLLNQVFCTDFRKEDSIELLDNKIDTKFYFPVFSAKNEKQTIRYRLISNRIENFILFSEWKQADYFLQIISKIPTENLEQQFNNLKTSAKSILIFQIDINKLKKNSFEILQIQ